LVSCRRKAKRISEPKEGVRTYFGRSGPNAPRKWPFNEATCARVITLASSAAATIIARMLLDPVGL